MVETGIEPERLGSMLIDITPEQLEVLEERKFIKFNKETHPIVN